MRSDGKTEVNTRLSAYFISLISTFSCRQSDSPLGFLQVAVLAVMFTVLAFFSGREDVGKITADCVPSRFNWALVLAIKSWLNRPKQVVLQKQKLKESCFE
jgi:hypothetical protein